MEFNDEEFVEYAKNGGLRIFMEPLNNLVAKMIRNKGLSYKCLDLNCCSFYFSGWTGGNNYILFLKAFRRWLEN